MNTHRMPYRRTTARQRIPKRIPKPISQPLEPLQVAEQELIPGQRYTIYYIYHEHQHQESVIFRARFVNLYHYQSIQAGNPPTSCMAKAIHFDCIDYEPLQRTCLSIPFDWISQMTNLITILQNKSPLPDDVLRIIDSYL